MPAQKKVKLINPKREPLTVEKLRELSGLNLSDEEAHEMVDSISLLAKILKVNQDYWEHYMRTYSYR